MYHGETVFFTVFDGYRLSKYGKVRPKNFYCAHAKVFILRKKSHESTQMVPGVPQKNFFIVSRHFVRILKDHLGEGKISPPQTSSETKYRDFSWRGEKI